MYGMKGLTYFINGKLYLSLTNRCNAANSITVRGPSFQWGKDFVQLPRGMEPSADMLSTAVCDAFQGGHITVNEKETEELITFAGYGEPLLCSEVLCVAAAHIKQTSFLYGTVKPIALRVKTNGLIAPDQCADLVNQLKLSGIDKISVGLQSDNETQYNEIMQPQQGRSFDDVCAFVRTCVAIGGLQVECTAVQRPGVDIAAVQGLATSLGAHSFASSKYFS